MKKILVPILALLLSQTADAQKLYVRGGLGYATAHGGDVQAPVFGYSPRVLLPTNGSNRIVNNSNSYSEAFDLKKASYTSGGQAVVALGMWVNNHVGIELAANVGLATRKRDISLSVNETENQSSFSVTEQAKLPLMFTPSVVVQSGGKINIYARGGIVLPVLSKITQDADYNENRFNQATNSFAQYRTISWTEEFSMRFSPGFSGAVGAAYKIDKHISLYGELGILSMSLYYKESELTAFRLTDQSGSYDIGDLTPSQKITKYEFSGTVNNNTNTVATSQAQFSNFNVTFGVMMDL